MTKAELLKQLIDIPDDSELSIYDLKDYTHRKFNIDTHTYFDYDKGLPIVVIHLDK